METWSWIWGLVERGLDSLSATTNNKKHISTGVIFGYDIYDVLSTGHIQLCYLDRKRAGPNFRGWEPLAKKEELHVIFCNRVGSVIQCDAGSCAGRPCQQFCHHLEGTKGVLSCLLPNFKRFFGSNRGEYEESGALPISSSFERILSSSRIFNHFNKRIPDGGVCEYCAELDRLQSIVEHNELCFFSRLIYNTFRVPTINRYFRDSAWLEKTYTVRFGSVSF